MQNKNTSIQVPIHDRVQSYNTRTSLAVIDLLLIIFQIIQSINQRFKSQEGKDTGQNNKIVVKKCSSKLAEFNDDFVLHHEKLQRLIKLIAKIKNEEIREKFKAQDYLWQHSGHDLNKHLYVVKQMYVKVFRAKNFLYYNQSRITQVAEQHSNFIQNSKESFNLKHIQDHDIEFETIEKSNENLRKKLQQQFMNKNKTTKEHSLAQIQRLAELVNRTEISNTKIIGFWTGAMLFILLGIIFMVIYFDITFKTQPQFEKTFPIWRGLSYFVFLIWLFAIQSYIFQTFGISFRLITTMNNYYIPKYPGLILCAAFFTSFHLLMFFCYILALAQFGIKFPDNFELHYLPAVSWIVMIVFFTFPFKVFHYRKRLYPIVMLLRAFASPVLGTEVKFHWWTEIWVSFRQPFRDLAFTFNYYFINSQILYEKTIIYETIAGVFLYTMRIIQNIRQMKQNNFIGGMPYYGSIKCFLNIITMLTSYFCRIKEDELPLIALILWVCSAIISTSYAYHFDLKYDWGLLESSPGNKYLRKELIYGKKKLYYGIIVFNLLFRFIWVLNISPDILRKIPVERYLLILIISFLQITRRGIWSTFRMEKQHIMYERYYNSIGITSNKEIEKAQVQNGDLLVEMEDLNKTYGAENEKVMEEIYDECEHEISPKKARITESQQSDDINEDDITTLRKERLLKMLTKELEETNEQIEEVLKKEKELLNALNIKEFDFIEHGRYSSF